MWDFSDFAMTFDNAGYLFDGTSPTPGPPPVVHVNIMPNLTGLEYPMALLALQQVGILVPGALGYFGTYPVSIRWQTSPFAPGTVLAQLPIPGTVMAVNSPLTLTVAEFPMAVAFP
jgi:hypothetical protein